MNCEICHKKLTSPKAIRNGMGDVCANKLKNMGGKLPLVTRVNLISSPSLFESRRTYSVFVEGFGKETVRLHKEGSDWFGYCECGIDDCEHFQAVRKVIKGGN